MTDDHEYMALLKCAECCQFKERLESMRIYRSAFIDGMSNVEVLTFKNHAKTRFHCNIMLLD